MDDLDEPGWGSRVWERMQPLRGTVPATATADAARRRLEREKLRFLVVVAPETGRLLGAVDRDALAPRACCRRPGARCTVVQHLAADVGFCFRHESASEVAETEAELAGRRRVPWPRGIPLIVVDERLKPLGCFSVGAAAERPAPAAAPRAA